MTRDARRFPRVRTRGECFAELGGGWEASVLDLSLGGMLLRLKRALTPSSSYFVKLILGRQVVVVEARVVRAGNGSGESWAGMEFRRLTPSDLSTLRRFIEGTPRA